MPPRHICATVALMLGAIAWATGLFFEPAPWERGTAAVIGAGVLVIAAVSVAGVLITSSRLGYWLGVSGLAVMLAIAALRTVDRVWVVAISLTALAGVLMADRRLGGWIRMEGPVAPVPTPASALGLLLLLAPTLTALTLLNSDAGVVVWLCLASWAALAWFVRRFPGAVWALRLGSPVLLIGGSWLESPGRWVWGSAMLAASILSWSSTVRLAVRPLIERGSRVSIPPELLPDDVRRAAGIDPDRR